MIFTIKPTSADLHLASVEALSMLAGRRHSCVHRESLVIVTLKLAASGEFDMFDATPAAGGPK